MVQYVAKDDTDASVIASIDSIGFFLTLKINTYTKPFCASFKVNYTNISLKLTRV